MSRDRSAEQPGERHSSRLPSTWLSFSGVLLVCFVLLDFILLSIFGYGGDWSPLWVAGRLARSDPAGLYDFAMVTKLQLPILGDVLVRPFVYPPSALLLFAPLSVIPFWISLACVSIGWSLCLALASSRAETDRLLLLVSPPVVLAAMTGQPTLLVAALAAAGFTRLKSDEVSAGVLLALAAMLKPTLLLMAPVGLLTGRHWRALASAGVTACAIVILSTMLFGVAPWLAWIGALPRFREVFDSFPALYRNGITPYAFALRMGFASDWVTLPMLTLATGITGAAFMRTDEWRARFVLVLGGSLLASPYAMNYELAAFAPVVLTMRRERLTDLWLPIVWASALFANASLVGLVAIYAWAVVRAFGNRSALAAGGLQTCPQT
jgi:Glycosyltransferase family 87